MSGELLPAGSGRSPVQDRAVEFFLTLAMVLAVFWIAKEGWRAALDGS